MRTYVVKHLTPNTTYYFRVRACNGCATGSWSSEISATTKSRFYLSTLEFVSTELETVKRKERGLECSFYTVQFSDSLWAIAQNLLEEGARFKELIGLNKEKYPSLASSNLLTVGWELDIECNESSETEKDVKFIEKEEAQERRGEETPKGMLSM